MSPSPKKRKLSKAEKQRHLRYVYKVEYCKKSCPNYLHLPKSHFLCLRDKETPEERKNRLDNDAQRKRKTRAEKNPQLLEKDRKRKQLSRYEYKFSISLLTC